jgi:hypothetical protein
MSYDNDKHLHDAYVAVFGSDAGRLVLADVMRCCGIDPDTLIAASSFDPEPARMAFKEGCREVGRHVLWRIKFSPTKENNNEHI